MYASVTLPDNYLAGAVDNYLKGLERSGEIEYYELIAGIPASTPGYSEPAVGVGLSPVEIICERGSVERAEELRQKILQVVRRERL